MLADEGSTSPTLHLEAGVTFSPAARTEKKFAPARAAFHAPSNFRFQQAFFAHVNIAIYVLAFYQRVIEVRHRTAAHDT